MRAYTAFFKKEWMEYIRTYKLFLMGILFFLLGAIGPLTAKYMPELTEAFLPAGMVLNLPAPTALDSWMQFFKNVSQIGLIVLVLVFSSSLSTECSRGTLIPLLTKGLSRKTVLLAKFTSSVLLWSGAFWLCFGVSWLYTRFFWDAPVKYLLLSASCLWLFGILLLCILMLAGTLLPTTPGTLLFTGGFTVLLFLLNIPPKFQEYNPLLLASGNTELLNGSAEPKDFLWPVLLCILIGGAALSGAAAVFNRKRV